MINIETDLRMWNDLLDLMSDGAAVINDYLARVWSAEGVETLAEITELGLNL